jgi:hypothetical protein
VKTTLQHTFRELDERRGTDGLRVRLLYERLTRTPLIEVIESFDSHVPARRFPVPADRAREAFQHPYAFAPSR